MSKSTTEATVVEPTPIRADVKPVRKLNTTQMIALQAIMGEKQAVEAKLATVFEEAGLEEGQQVMPDGTIVEAPAPAKEG